MNGAGRDIRLADDVAAIPERLLLAHARGEVLFLCGAGISVPSGLPGFARLVVDVYRALDAALVPVLERIFDDDVPERRGISRENFPTLTDRQLAEARCFWDREYDVVLGMLERRLDDVPDGASTVRQAVARILREPEAGPTSLHASLTRLSQEGGPIRVLTTNFDRLLEEAARRARQPVQSRSVGSLPRPARRDDFGGVLHIHGALERDPRLGSELVLTDRDFGEFYLRRRVVPEFIYDAARLFHLVLVGYSASDPPMKYLLSAVAADGARFDDLRERFTFVPDDGRDPVVMADWRARGITPIPYELEPARDNAHERLERTLARWAELAPSRERASTSHAMLRAIVAKAPHAVTQDDRDRFDFLVRRVVPAERARLSRLLSRAGASFAWLDALNAVTVGVAGSER